MINISFDNPFLLLLFIPLALVVIIPFCIAIRKENRSRGAFVALGCHLVMVVLAVLAIAGMKNTTVMTKTEVYVLADVSNSTSKKTDVIDGYIKELGNKLPPNSEIGVVTFASDYKLHTRLGEEFTTVAGSGVDDSATDIKSALEYVPTLFSGDTIKRVVLYTDGMSTDPNANSGLIRAIENLSDKDIYIDIVYIDSNIQAGDQEIQISDVEFNSSTYLNHSTSLNVLVESGTDSSIIIRLSKDGASYLEKTASLSAGYNIVNFDLDTAKAGEFNYSVTLSSPEDISDKNNSYSFTQIVNENISVLLITDKASDVDIVKNIYGDEAIIDAYVKPTPKNSSSKAEPFVVPFTVEDMCKYDEFVLSNVTIDQLENADSFVSSLDMCVSVFGKSLITAGDNNLTNNDAKCVESLNSMLPVNFGNTDADPKLYVIVIDASRSMEFQNFDYFKMAKAAGKHLLDLLNENDDFALVYFSGEVEVPYTPTRATKDKINEAKQKIDSLYVTQGTMIGKTLDRVCTMLESYTYASDKQVMLISDGMSFEGGEVYADDPVGSAKKLKDSGVILSTLNAGNPDGVTSMQNIAAAGGGKYYFSKSSSDLEGVMFDQIADDITDTFVTGTIPVYVNRHNDSVMQNIGELPPIGAYIYSKPKASADNILYVDYEKASGAIVKAPLYSYWGYGNGKVSTLTTSIGGEWASSWESGDGAIFLGNVAATSTPAQRVDYPYTVDVTFDGKFMHIEIIPIVINPDASMSIRITLPNNTEITEELSFDSYRYFYKFETKAIGKYQIDTDYSLSTKAYSASTAYNISYSPEYNSFASFSPAVLHSVIRDNGTVTENKNAELTVDEDRLDTYVVSFTVPLLTAAAVIYVIDTIIRKLRWADIVSFFKKRKREGTK